MFDLLADACWPERHASVMEQLLQQGDDAVDVLATIAHSCHTGSSADDGGSSSRGALFLGVAFHARMALAYVRGDRCAARLQQLLAQQQAGSAAGAAGDDGVLEVALLLVRPLGCACSSMQLASANSSHARAHCRRRCCTRWATLLACVG